MLFTPCSRLIPTSTLAVGLVGLSLLLAVPAGAATSFTLGTGGNPRIAMAGTTAHIVWLADNGNIRYCRLPQGAQRCSASKEFSPPGLDGWRQPFVLTYPGSSRVVIVTGRPGSIVGVAFTSTDGGSTFPSVGTEIGDLLPRAAARGPGANDISVLGSGEPAIVSYQKGNLFGPRQTFEAGLERDIAYQYSYALGMHGQIPVAAYSGLNDTKFSYYKGSGDIHDPANWNGPLPTPAPGGSSADLVDGPGGVYLMRNTPGRSEDKHNVSRFTGSGFDASRAVPGSGDSNNSGDLFQDASGRLHVVYHVLMGGGVSAFRYTSSADGGATWTALGDVIRETTLSGDVAVGASGPGQGLAVWATSLSQNGDIKAAALSPLIPVPGSGSGGSGSGSGSSDTSKPVLGSLSLSDSSLTPGQGAKFSFTSSEAGLATLTFAKRVKGLKLRSKGKVRCLVETKSRLGKLRRSLAKKAKGRKLAAALRKRRCKTFKTIGRIQQRATAGRNEIVFSGRVAGRKLSPGRYRAQLAVADAAGNVSRTETVNFKVIANKKKKRRARR